MGWNEMLAEAKRKRDAYLLSQAEFGDAWVACTPTAPEEPFPVNREHLIWLLKSIQQTLSENRAKE